MDTGFSETTPPLRPALVGRQAELSFFRDRIAETLEGRGAVVLVPGESGTGKTRLMAEVGREAGERGMLVLGSAGDPGRTGVAYGLFLGVLEGYLQHASSCGRRSLLEAVETLVPHLRDFLLPKAEGQAGHCAAGGDPELCQALFLARVSRLLLELAQQSPMVLCLDDLHWGDSASLRLLHWLARRSATAPLLIVGSYRSEAGAPELEGRLWDLCLAPHVSRLTLQGLSAAETNTMIDSCFASADAREELSEGIYRKTGGVPRYIVQYLQLLCARGSLDDQGRVRLGRRDEELGVPAAMRAVLEARLQGLSEEQRFLLSHAAIQGQVFEGGLVAQAMGWPRAGVLRELGRLERETHLVRRAGRGFCFAHGLFADLCCELLPAAQRRSIHLALASVLKEERPEEAETLAYHFHQAGAPVRALPYLLEAGERARAASAFREARRFLEQALEVIEGVEAPAQRRQRMEVLLALAQTETRRGEAARASQRCREVLRVSRPEEDGAIAARALFQLGELECQKGGWAEAGQLYHEALALSTQVGDQAQCARAYLSLGSIALRQGRPEEAADRFAEAQAIAWRSNDELLLGAVSLRLVVAGAWRGQYVEAVVHGSRALRVYRRAGCRHGLCQAYAELGVLHARQQEWEVALRCLRKSAELAREMGVVDLLAGALVHQAGAQVGAGDTESAQTSCRAARLLLERLRDRRGLAECYKVQGVICRKQEQHVLAEEWLQRSRASFGELEDQFGLAGCDRELGILRQERGDPEGAVQRLEEASELFGRIGAEEEARKTGELLAAVAA